jgi:dienelactone hydrolase
MRLSSAAACVVLLTVLITFPARPVEGYLTEVVTIPSGDIKLRALLGRPEGAGPFPAYIHNHGSMTFEQAHGRPWPTSIAEGTLADTLARAGYVVLVLYRRGHKGSGGTTSTYSGITSGSYTDRIATDIMRGAEAETGDVIAALEYLRAQPYVDGDRVAVGGHSLGGLVSVMAATRDRRFAALISMAGGIAWMSRGGGHDEAKPLVRGVWKEAASRVRIPVLILWSENDWNLNEAVGRELETELRRAGRHVEMKVYPAFQQNGHALFGRAEGYPVFVPDVVRFLDAHLRR